MTKKSGARREVPCMGEILTNAKTFFASGKIVSPSIHASLAGAEELPDQILGRMIKKHIEGLSDEEAGQRVKEFFAEPSEEIVGAYMKRCVTRRLERIDKE